VEHAREHGEPDDAAPDAAGPEADRSEYELLLRHRLKRHVRVDQPLVFVSQIQRCGGTLLSQLFDGHPELHAHPHELQIGFPENKQRWPKLDPERRPERWQKMLHEPTGDRSFKRGYTKYTRKHQEFEGEELDVFPFLQPPGLLRDFFVRDAHRDPPGSARDILDRYFTAYFNCWLDNQNLYAPGKQWVTGFSPRMMMRDANVEAFFADYPDGRLISMIREPVSWYASAIGHLPDFYADPVASTEDWRASAEAMLRALERHGPERVLLISFERLVAETEASMRAIASWLGIAFTPELLVPTFNGRPIKADSSFKVETAGVLQDTLDRTAHVDDATRKIVLQTAGDALERVLARAQ
jgi:hypothetical protein